MELLEEFLVLCFATCKDIFRVTFLFLGYSTTYYVEVMDAILDIE